MRVMTSQKRRIDPMMGKAILSMKKFFAEKKWWCGGPVPKAALLTENHINMVINVDLIRAVDVGYAAIERSKKLARTPYKEDCEIELCLNVLHECESLGIPQQFIGGIFLLYLKLCEKVEL